MLHKIRRFFAMMFVRPQKQDDTLGTVSTIQPAEILNVLLTSRPQPTNMTPKNCRGIYGLFDHLGDLRYIGSTSSANETFYKRIHQRHRTGSESHSHYFSRMYNTGRMWRLRNDPETNEDGLVAKALRNEFIAQYCGAAWVPLPDDCDIVRLEKEVIAIAPAEAVAWNSHGMATYTEPTHLVDELIERMALDKEKIAALDRQMQRFISQERLSPDAHSPISRNRADKRSVDLPVFPVGPFDFFALDVETANHNRSSICQIGVACVRPDNTIETWVTYVDPKTDVWAFTGLHGIDSAKVSGAPTFHQALELLESQLAGKPVFQHSGFDRSAIRSACGNLGRDEPVWTWENSVTLAREAWPHLTGNGGHGLASLKSHLGLEFEHHDAGEDARAAAEVVLYALGRLACPKINFGTKVAALDDEDDFELIDDGDISTEMAAAKHSTNPLNRPLALVDDTKANGSLSVIGTTVLTPGNINNNHFYIRSFLHAFPDDCIGGSNTATAATRMVTIHWGSGEPVLTDIDGSKKMFRKRGWVGNFFRESKAKPGDTVTVALIRPYEYRVSIAS